MTGSQADLLESKKLEIRICSTSNGKRTIRFGKDCPGHEVKEVKEMIRENSCDCPADMATYGASFCKEQKLILYKEFPELLLD